MTRLLRPLGRTVPRRAIGSVVVLLLTGATVPVLTGQAPAYAARACAGEERCFDFGDAPERYGTSPESGGPRHRVDERLALGEVTTAERVPSSPDSGDDAVTAWPSLTAGETGYAVSVTVANGTRRAATLAGWIDFDGDGAFEDGERAVAKAAVGVGPVELSWPKAAPVEGETYARLRLFAGDVADSRPSGGGGKGEVEDHRLDVGPAKKREKAEPGPSTRAEAHPDCPAPIMLTNGSFESPLAPSGSWKAFPESQVPGWSTTATDGFIELWDSGFNGVVSADGGQHAELNANQVSTLYQDLPTTPGLTLAWSLFHRGRNGMDTMRVQIGPPGGPGISQVPDGQTNANITDGNGQWGFHHGTYTVPAGQTTTRFAFQSVSAAGGNATIGNFLDGIAFGTPPCLVPEKSAEPAPGTSVDEGDTITYAIPVTNHGGNPSQDTTVVDTIPAGTTFVPGSIRVTGPDGAVSRVADADGFDGARITAGIGNGADGAVGGMVNVGETWTVTFDVTVDEGTAPGPVVNTGRLDYREKPGSPFVRKETPAVEHPVNIPDVDITKAVDDTDPRPGDVVTYTVTAENVGEAPVEGRTITDDLTEVLDDATYNGDASATSGLVSFDAPELTWTGDIAPGESVTITYSVTVDSPPGGDATLINAVTSDIPGSNCPAGSPSADCYTQVPTPSLEIAKTASPATAKAGDTVAYTVTVANKGAAGVTGTSITDDLTGVLDDAAYNGDAVATSGIVSVAEPTLTWTGDVPADGTVTITYSVTVGAPPAGDSILRNAVTGPAGSSCPPRTPNPACTATVPVAYLTIAKSASDTSIEADGTVEYTVTIRNTGEADYIGAVVTDDLTGVLDDASYNGDAVATSGIVSVAEPTLTWTGDVPAGGAVTVTYSVTAGSPPGGDAMLTNVVTGPSGSSCEPGAVNAACTSDVPVAYLDIAKTTPVTDVLAGATVPYTITVTNPGTAAYTGASVTDDLTGVLDDAAYNDDADATSGEVSYTEPVVTWTGDVPAGGTVTITYSVTVGSPPGGDVVLRNAVVGPRGSSCEPGVNAVGCVTQIPSAFLEIAKTASVSDAEAGETVTYTVTITNTGTTAYDDATVSDDLTGVLDDAVYNDDADADVGTVSFDDPALTWNGNVPAGETVTLTYSVTVGDPEPIGDGYLLNTVTGPSGSDCRPGAHADACGTVTDVRRFDYGDAPDSYGTTTAANGPYHQLVPGLRLGGSVDADRDGDPDPLAAGDSEDDSTTDLRAHPAGDAGYEADVEVLNETGADALLVGWIDFDVDGTFDAAERAEITVPSAVGVVERRLTWRGVVAPGEAETFARLRLCGEVPAKPQEPESAAEDLPADPVPTGFGGGGEVEDYLIRLTTPAQPPAGMTLPVTGTALTTMLHSGLLLLLFGSLALLTARRRSRGGAHR